VYRMLIVDDEEQIVDWLYEMFKSEKGMELDVFKAYSGSEALEWLNKTAIDIVLADINMPGMDGIELMKRIKENWSSCRVIFLTGYDNFDYVYTAQKYEGVSYLLKSESDAEIVKAIEKAIHEIETSFRNNELVIKAKEQREKMLPVMQKDFLTDLVDGMITDSEDIGQKFDEIDIPLLAVHPFIMLVGRVDPAVESSAGTLAAPEAKNGMLGESKDLLSTVNFIIEKYMHSDLSYIYIVHERTYLVWFIQPAASLSKFGRDEVPETLWNVTRNRIKDLISSVQASCRETLGITVSFALGNKTCKWSSTADMYALLRRQLNNRIGLGNEMILIDDSFNYNQKDNQRQSLETEKSYSRLKRASALSNYLESGRRKEFYELLHHMTEVLEKIKSKNHGIAIEIYYTIA
jgi:two-component system response regulator YesN